MREGAESPRLINATTYRDVVFARVDWTGKNFYKVHFVSCRFEDVLLTDVTFEQCVFEGCQFDMATFERVVFKGGLLQETQFFRSELGGTVFKSKHANQRGVVDTEPMLSNCTFKDVGLEQSEFYCFGYYVALYDVTMQDTMIFQGGVLTPVSGNTTHAVLNFTPPVMVSMRQRGRA